MRPALETLEDRVVPAGGLSIAMNAVPAPSVTAGSPITYNVTVTNTDRASAATITKVTDTLPASLIPLTESYVSGPNGFINASAGNAIKFDASGGSGSLPSLQSDVFQIVALVSPSQTSSPIVNTAIVGGSPVVTGAASVTTSVTTSADVSVGLNGQPTITPGSTVTYSLTVANQGPSESQNVVVTDVFPSGLALLSTTRVFGTDSFTNNSNLATGNIAYSFTTLGSGSTDVFRIVATASPTLAGPLYVDQASASTGTTDPNNGNNNATFTSTVSATADLSVSQTVASPITPGKTVTYTLTLTNTGPSNATGVTLTDIVPFVTSPIVTPVANSDGLISSISDNAVSGFTVSLTGATVSTGSADVFLVSGLVSSADITNVTNTVSVTATTADLTPADNSSTLTTPITFSSDLAVTKTGPTSLTAGSTGTYTITVTNSGPSDAHSVTLTDSLPGGLTFVSSSIASGNPDNFSTTNTLSLSPFTATTVKANSTDIFYLVVSAPSNLTLGSKYGDTAFVFSSVPNSDPNEGNNLATFTSTIATFADLTASKTGPGANVFAGQTVTYTLTLADTGPSDAQNVTLSDSLPANLTLISEGTVPGNPDSFSAFFSGNTAFFSATKMGASHTDHFTVVAVVSTSLSSGATVVDPLTVTSSTNSSITINPASSTSTVTTSADLSITKTGPATITAGSTVTYQLTVTNLGPSDGPSVTVTDTLPAGLTFVSASVISNPDNFGQPSSSVPSFVSGDVLAGSSDVFQIVAVVASTLTANGTRVDQATVSSPNDLTVTNNTVTFVSTVATSADLSVTKSGPATVAAGGVVTYTLTLVNAGPSQALAVSLTDTLPSGLTLLSESALGTNPDSFSAGSSGNNATFLGGSVGAGRTDQFLVVASAASTLPASFSLFDQATVTSFLTTDPNTANNFATFTTTVTTSADVSVAKSGPATAAPGSTVTYSLTVADLGPSAAQNVTLTDALPSGMTLLSVSAVGTNPDSFQNKSSGNTVSFSANTVGASNTDVFQVVAFASSGLTTALVNTATVASPTDTTPLDNTATFTTTLSASADLSVSKIGPISVTAGSTVTYFLALANKGPSDAQLVTLTDALPSGLTILSQSTSALNPDTFVNAGSGTFTAAAVAAGHTDLFQIVAVAGSNLVNNTTLTDLAIGSSPTLDANALNNVATFTSTVTSNADLAITKSGPATVVAGGTATYLLTVTNPGPSDAQVVKVTDTLPTGLTLVSQSQVSGLDSFAQSGSGTTAIFSASTVGAGHTDVLQVIATVTSTLAPTSSLVDQAVVASPTDTNGANNTATFTSAVSTSADLSITKTGPTQVTSGATATYTLTVRNLGPSDSQAVTISDLLPAGLTLVSESAVAGNPDAFLASGSPGTAFFTGTTVGAGHTDQFVVVVAVSPTLTLNASQTDTATVTSGLTPDPTVTNNLALFVSTVTTAADLSVTKTGPATVTAGGTATYTITLANLGASPGASITLTDVLPSGMTLKSESQVSGTDTFLASAVGNNAQFTAGTMPGGNTDVFQVVAVAASSLTVSTSLSDHVTVTAAADTNTANNTATFYSTVTTSADLSVTKTGPIGLTAGATATYTITLRNTGPSDAQAVSLTDTLPGNLTLVTEGIVTNNDGFVNNTSGTVPTFQATTVAAGHSDVFQVVVSAPSSLSVGTPLVDVASTGSTTNDSNGANNNSTLTSTIVASADLVIAKSGPATITAGGTGTYTLTVINSGPSDALGAVVTDQLPAGLTITSVSAGFGNPDVFSGSGAGTGTATFNAAGAVGASHTDTLYITVTASSSLTAGSLIDLAKVTASTFDPTTPDVTSFTSTVATSADLSVTKSGPNTITAGSTATYTIVLTNKGPSDAQTVNLTDTLPPNLVLVTETVLNNPDSFQDNTNGGTIPTFNATTVAAGHTDVFLVVATAPSSVTAATIVDSATATASTPDPNSTNNSSTYTTSVRVSADLSVSKSGPTTITAGNSATYTLTVVNSGPSDAQGAVLTDQLPTGLTVISLSSAFTNPDTFNGTGTGTGTATFTAAGAVTAGSTDVFQIVVGAAPTLTAGTSAVDQAKVTATTFDPTRPDFASFTSTIVTSADLSITKTGPAGVTAGGTATYTISVVNLGPSAAQNVSLTDALPTGLVLVSESAVANPDAFQDNTSGGPVPTFNAVSVAPNSTDIFWVTVAAASNVTQGTQLVDTATVSSPTSDPRTINNSISFTSTISASADLSIAKSGPTTATAGAGATFTLTLSNFGPSDAQGVTLTDALPAGMTVQSAIPVSGNLDAFTASGLNTSTATFTANTTVGANHTDTFLVVATPASTMANNTPVVDRARVTATTSDPTTVDNTATLTTTVVTSADVGVVKTGPNIAAVGRTLTYTLTVSNFGPSAAQNVSLTDALPPGVTLLGESAISNPDGFVKTSSSTTPSFNAAMVGAGRSDVFAVTVSVASTLTSGTPLVDVANVSSTTTDNNSTNNSSTLTSTVTIAADLSVTKSGPTSITAGGTGTYTLTLANLGPSDATGAVLTDQLPAGLTVTSLSAAFGNPDAFSSSGGGSGTATFTANTTVAAGNTDVFQIVVSAVSSLTQGSPLVDQAKVTATTSDPTTANNTITFTSTVATKANVTLTDNGPKTLAAGGTYTYSLTLTNNGPSDAQKVSVTDIVPAGLVLVTEFPVTNPDNFVGSSSGNTASFTANTVAAGHTDMLDVVFMVPRNATNGTVTDSPSFGTSTADPPGDPVTSTITVFSDMAVTKTGPASVTAGVSATYSITLTNNGPSDAQGVVLTDLLPTGASLVSITQVFGTDAFTQGGSGSTVSETANSSVAFNSTDIFRLVVLPASSLTAGASFSDTATVTSTTSDTVTSNNVSTVSSAVAATATLSVAKSGPSTATQGGSVTYTLTLTESGPSNATSVTLTDTLPAGLTFVTASFSQGAVSSAGNTVSDVIATLAVGATVTGTVVAQVIAAAGTVTDTASVSTSTSVGAGSQTTATASSSVTVGPIVLSALPFAAVEFAPATSVTVATFTAAGGLVPPSTFSATIAWGDGGTSVGTVVQNGSTYAVVGSHTYGVDNGQPIVTVTVTEPGAMASATVAVSIQEAPLPPGSPGTFLDQPIQEVLEHAFNQPTTGGQITQVETAMLWLDAAIIDFLMNSGTDWLTAALDAGIFSWIEFQFIVGANSGGTMNNAVNAVQKTFFGQAFTFVALAGNS